MMQIATNWNANAPAMKRAGFIVVLSFSVFVIPYVSGQQAAPAMPMQARYEDGAEFRWLHKKVLDSPLVRRHE